MSKIYPDSEVELTPFLARYYDQTLNALSLGYYGRFIKRAIREIWFGENDSVLDLACGTGKNDCLIRKQLSDEGKIVGLDISPEMKEQFEIKCSRFDNVSFKEQRIDVDFDLGERFDKVFISFALHGFPNEVRKTIIGNAAKHLKNGGEFIILDYSEFDLDAINPLYRTVFKLIECKYAFDFIKRDWKSILKDYGFAEFKEKFYFLGFVRTLIAKKSS